MELIRGKESKPWKILVYGTPGIGKSTVGTFAPKPVFLDLEKGLARIDCVKTPTIKTYDELIEAIKELAASEEFETIVFDTLDGLEEILSKKILEDDGTGKTSLAEFKFGQGYNLLRARFTNFIRQMEYLNERGKNVLLIGHDTIKAYNDPMSESYDRYQIALHSKSAEAIFAAMDAVLFASYETAIREDKGKFGSDRVRAMGTGRRIVHTAETPSFLAKNRFDLKPIEELNEKLFEKIK